MMRGLVVLALFTVSCRDGCSRGAPSPARDPLLALVPAEARVVASVDLAKIRATAVWKRLSELVEEDPGDQKVLAELTARTGLDPMRQVHRVLAAFPEDARSKGEFALVIAGDQFDERRLAAYARDQADLRGRKIEQVTRGSRPLWTSRGVAAFFLGGTTFALGAGGWGERMADLADRTPVVKSAADDPDLGMLIRRVRMDRAIWFAAVVPMDVRRALIADPRYDSAASVTRMAGAIDLGPGLSAELVADLSNAADARALVQRIEESLSAARRNAKVLMLGLGPYLETVGAQAEGPSVRVSMTLRETQVNDLLSRLAGMARMARAQRKR